MGGLVIEKVRLSWFCLLRKQVVLTIPLLSSLRGEDLFLLFVVDPFYEHLPVEESN